MANVCLAAVKTLPNLYKGRVVIIMGEGFIFLKPSKNTAMADKFDPMNYSILIDPKYPRCIVYSNQKERDAYIKMVNKGRTEKAQQAKIRKGDLIHLHSKSGTYTVHDVSKDYLVLTCGTWRYTTQKYRRVLMSDYKCHYGGGQGA